MVQIGIDAIPGYKLCPTCRVQVNERLNPVVDADSLSGGEPPCYEIEVAMISNRETLNSTLNELELTPSKLHSIPHHLKVKHGKRKIEQVNDAMSKRLASVLNVDELDLSTNEPSSTAADNNATKADDLDHLVMLLKEKLKLSNRRGKIQVLIFTPRSWSIRKAASEFNVSKKTIQKARKLCEKKGLLEMPEHIKGKTLKQEVVDLVKAFYCDDEFTQQLPGKNDCVSIGKKQYMSKRLILCNLKELHTLFKKKYPDIKIGFSKFASLHPKWCISVGPKGTHSVCVCTIHQNLKLMLSAVSLSKHYHELVEMIVCNRDSKECMVHRCPSCPGKQKIQTFLEENLLRNESDNDDCDSDDNNDENDENEETIAYKQWTTTDRAELVSHTVTTEDFVDILAEKIDKITAHSYITRAQAQYIPKILKRTFGQ